MALMHHVDAGARWAPALRALPDERLARMVEGGNDSAFSAIYARYAPVLHGYCRSLLKDEEEAGDALQNAMLKAMQAMRKASRTGPLRPWLFRIAHNESITIIRQRSRRPGELDDNLVAGGGDAFRHASAREDLAALLRDLESLTQYQRSALVMRELGGLSYDEIALALETTPLAARQAVFAAKRKLDPDQVKSSRKRFKLLLPPAPAGFALLSGLFGGGGAAGGTGLVAKTLMTAAAVSAVGVGSVEVVSHAPIDGASAKTTTVARADRAARHAARQTGTAVVATATPAVRRSPRAAATAAPVATRAADQPSVGARLAGAIAAESAPTATPTSEITFAEATPTPSSTSTTEPVSAPQGQPPGQHTADRQQAQTGFAGGSPRQRPPQPPADGGQPTGDEAAGGDQTGSGQPSGGQAAGGGWSGGGQPGTGTTGGGVKPAAGGSWMPGAHGFGAPPPATGSTGATG